MASRKKRNDKEKVSSRAKKNTRHLKHESQSGRSGNKLPKPRILKSGKGGSENQTTQTEHHLNFISQSEKHVLANGTARLYNKSAWKRKKAILKLGRRSYSLRSLDSGRNLRSTTNTAKSKPPDPVSNPENSVATTKKRKKNKVKKSGQDELSKIKKHIKYLINRMNYEQSLIDAYAGEGWRGQSAEKIRPEKELERAKSEILRCKLKIREIFQRIDSLLAEGRLQESLFDPDGIDSESIFCGTCGSADVSANNDIVLCDGICERGFHQKCLNPPLLSDDIPAGDEGWLCPQCDCKVDCIDLLNEFRGTDLSIEDSWERIFPELAALANGNKQLGDMDLPSDDSEDDDYNPDAVAVNVDEQDEESSYEDSYSRSSSHDSISSDTDVNQTILELPTDDSEDDDFDPDVPDPDKEIYRNKSSSDESDFTSDSDDFCAELRKTSCANEVSSSSLQNKEVFVASDGCNIKDKDKPSDYSEISSVKLEADKQEIGLKSSNRRHLERLDYKMLYDEAYGNTSSNSSDDDEWNEMSASKRLKRMGIKENKKVANDNFASTTQKLQTIFASSAAEKEHSPPEQYSSRSTTARRKSGVSSKKLYEAFHQNQYPTREMKESLAQELCITFQQVSKWFDNARHCFRVNSKESINVRMSTSDKVNVCRETSTSHSNLDKGEMTKLPGASTLCKAIDAIQTTRKANPENKKLEAAFQDNQFPSREKKEELAQQLGRTFDQVSVWFKNARRRHSRTSAKESSNAGTSSSDKAEAHCRTPTSRESGIGVPEQSPGLFTTEEAIITSTPNHVKPDNIIQMSRRDSTLDMVTTPRSCTSLWKLEHDVDLESPGVSVENGASKEKSKKGHVAKNPNTRSEKSKASGGGDIELGDSRQKAIAKELRRRKIGR